MHKIFTPPKCYWFFLKMIFPLGHVTPNKPEPISNNQIRPQDILTKHWIISPCPRQDTDKPDVMVRGSRLDFIWI